MEFNPAAHALDDPLAFDDSSVRSALRSGRRLRTEVLAGLVVALALIPEAISFSIIAGVDPQGRAVRRRSPWPSRSPSSAAGRR